MIPALTIADLYRWKVLADKHAEWMHLPALDDPFAVMRQIESSAVQQEGTPVDREAAPVHHATR
jgi:hypothetical protein